MIDPHIHFRGLTRVGDQLGLSHHSSQRGRIDLLLVLTLSRLMSGRRRRLETHLKKQKGINGFSPGLVLFEINVEQRYKKKRQKTFCLLTLSLCLVPVSIKKEYLLTPASTSKFLWSIAVLTRSIEKYVRPQVTLSRRRI